MAEHPPPRPVAWQDRPPAVVLLDQTRLPCEETYRSCPDVPSLIEAIRSLAVRGAPLLGVAGGYGVALAAARGDDVPAVAADLAAARPTAVNLRWAVRRVLDAWERRPASGSTQAAAALAAARALEAADAAAAEALVAAGAALLPANARVLTHCNTGRLVSAGPGTALGIVEAGYRAGRVSMLWIDETRPLLQGARLTAWEAARAGIPHRVLVDGAAGSLLARGQVDLVLVGADRIAADGSVANKVGTYPLAVLAATHRVPFVVAAPSSTIDLQTATGAAIPIEERADREVLEPLGTRAAPATSAAYNPAFDVTPPALVSALVTETGVISPVTPDAIAAATPATVPAFAAEARQGG
jgi:methylthioribose-1-phosphate isomerase